MAKKKSTIIIVISIILVISAIVAVIIVSNNKKQKSRDLEWSEIPEINVCGETSQEKAVLSEETITQKSQCVDASNNVVVEEELCKDLGSKPEDKVTTCPTYEWDEDSEFI